MIELHKITGDVHMRSNFSAITAMEIVLRDRQEKLKKLMDDQMAYLNAKYIPQVLSWSHRTQSFIKQAEGKYISELID